MTSDQQERIKGLVEQARLAAHNLSTAILDLESKGCNVTLLGWRMPEDEDDIGPQDVLHVRYFKIEVTQTTIF